MSGRYFSHSVLSHVCQPVIRSLPHFVPGIRPLTLCPILLDYIMDNFNYSLFELVVMNNFVMGLENVSNKLFEW